MCIIKSNLKYGYILLIKLYYGIVLTNSSTSTLWKLNSDETKIIEGNIHKDNYKNTNESLLHEDDLIFNIISSSVHFGESWIKGDIEYLCTNCHNVANNSLPDKY